MNEQFIAASYLVCTNHQFIIVGKSNKITAIVFKSKSCKQEIFLVLICLFPCLCLYFYRCDLVDQTYKEYFNHLRPVVGQEMKIPRNNAHRLGSGWLKLRYASDDVLFDLHNAFKTNKF